MFAVIVGGRLSYGPGTQRPDDQLMIRESYLATAAAAADLLAHPIELLASLAARRHGAVPLIRALTRGERAPESIAAF